MFLAFAAVAFSPRLFFRCERFNYSDMITEVLGISFVLLGQIFRASARGFKSEHSHSGHELIQKGPYAFVRNPMYLGILLIGLGIALVLFKWWVVVLFLFVFFLRYVMLIFKEEKKLLAAFPAEYPAYMKSVPRIFPSARHILSTDASEYLPLKISWIKKEIGSISAVLLVILALEFWKDVQHKGLTGYFKEVTLIVITLILFLFFAFYLIKKTGNIKNDISNKSKTN